MRSVFIIFLIICYNSSFSQQPTDNRKTEIVFQNVNVIPMVREQILENQTVVVKDGKITSMGSANQVKFGDNANIIDGKGKYLIPGLAEMHAHVPPANDLEPMKEVLRLFALHGITTIRGMLGHPRHLELRDKIRSGEIMGPNFITSGPAVSGQSAKSASQAAELVREQKKAGYDFLKVLPGLDNDSFSAMVETAKEVGITYAGHVPFEVGIWRAIEAGYATIDHLDGFVEGLVPGIENMTSEQAGLFGVFIGDQADKSQIPKLIDGLKKQNIWVVPTQALAERWMSPVPAEEFMNAPEMKYMAEETRNNWLKSKNNLLNNPNYENEKVEEYLALRRYLIKECQENGVGLLLGCDAPQVFNVPGISTHHELRYLVDSGLSPYEALRTGTVNVATFLNKPNSGTIKTGNVSDLVLLNGNPLQNIDESKNIEGVMLGNLWLPHNYVQQELKKLEK
ncbi:amidohydrolase family protein [soil metagenome]